MRASHGLLAGAALAVVAALAAIGRPAQADPVDPDVTITCPPRDEPLQCVETHLNEAAPNPDGKACTTRADCSPVHFQRRTQRIRRPSAMYASRISQSPWSVGTVPESTNHGPDRRHFCAWPCFHCVGQSSFHPMAMDQSPSAGWASRPPLSPRSSTRYVPSSGSTSSRPARKSSAGLSPERSNASARRPSCSAEGRAVSAHAAPISSVATIPANEQVKILTTYPPIAELGSHAGIANGIPNHVFLLLPDRF